MLRVHATCKRPLLGNLIILFSCLLFMQAPSIANAQGQTADLNTDKVKSLLLRYDKWEGIASGLGAAAFFTLEFERAGEQVKVKINNTDNKRYCERDVIFPDLDTVKFDGCRDHAITLKFDPNDPVWKFKGKSGMGYDYKIQEMR